MAVEVVTVRKKQRRDQTRISLVPVLISFGEDFLSLWSLLDVLGRYFPAQILAGVDSTTDLAEQLGDVGYHVCEVNCQSEGPIDCEDPQEFTSSPVSAQRL